MHFACDTQKCNQHLNTSCECYRILFIMRANTQFQPTVINKLYHTISVAISLPSNKLAVREGRVGRLVACAAGVATGYGLVPGSGFVVRVAVVRYSALGVRLTPACQKLKAMKHVCGLLPHPDRHTGRQNIDFYTCLVVDARMTCIETAVQMWKLLGDSTHRYPGLCTRDS